MAMGLTRPIPLKLGLRESIGPSRNAAFFLDEVPMDGGRVLAQDRVWCIVLVLKDAQFSFLKTACE